MLSSIEADYIKRRPADMNHSRRGQASHHDATAWHGNAEHENVHQKQVISGKHDYSIQMLPNCARREHEYLRCRSKIFVFAVMQNTQKKSVAPRERDHEAHAARSAE